MKKQKIQLKSILFVALLLITFNSCHIYSFTSTYISPDVKTYTISEFPNRARVVNPALSDYFTEELRTRIDRQTSLENSRNNGDIEFEGSIVGYDIKPISIKSNDEASQNRLTIQIRVKYTNNRDHDKDFESDFSHYADFSSDILFSDVEETLMKTIVEEIINLVYNKSLANW